MSTHIKVVYSEAGTAHLQYGCTEDDANSSTDQGSNQGSECVLACETQPPPKRKKGKCRPSKVKRERRARYFARLGQEQEEQDSAGLDFNVPQALNLADCIQPSVGLLLRL